MSRFDSVCMLALFTLLSACGKMEAIQSPLRSAAAACTTSRVQLKDDPFKNNGVKILGHKSFSAGTKMYAVVDETCMGKIDSTPSGLRAVDFELEKTTTTEELNSIANNDPCILKIAESKSAKPHGVPNDTYYRYSGHLTNLKYAEATDIFFGNTGIKNDEEVVIAIIDTGVYIAHPDLRNRVWVNPGEIPDNNIDDDKNGYVDDVNGYNFESQIGDPSPQVWPGDDEGFEGHGTHVAGLAAAQSNNSEGGAGIMGSNVKIMALNVYGPSPSVTTSSHIYNAIRYAIVMGADVINLSLGVDDYKDEVEGSVISEAINAGVVVVVSAGNNSLELTNSHFVSPASFGASKPGMITVGASDSRSSALASYSNFSTNFVEIAAPGSEDSTIPEPLGLVSTYSPYMGEIYGRIYGTSMSAPIVAGAAALAIGFLKSRGYNPSPATIESILETSARAENGLVKIKDSKHLDLLLLARYLDTNFPSTSAPNPNPAPSPNPTNPPPAIGGTCI